MNWSRLILRNLWFYRKPYLAVLAGVVISTAVLTGALVVGDSVRYSLKQLTDIRLGKIRYALQSDNRLFRLELANEISSKLHIPVAPILQVNGMAINSDKNLRINQVQVIGVNNQFGQFRTEPLPVPTEDEAIISRNTANKLDLKVGNELLLRIQKKGKAPTSAPFVAEKTPSVSLRIKVIAIADDQQFGRFSLKSNQTAPFNVFISLEQMASLLELPGLANQILVTGNDTAELTTHLLDSTVGICWKPIDAGLHFRKLSVGAGIKDQGGIIPSGLKGRFSQEKKTLQRTREKSGQDGDSLLGLIDSDRMKEVTFQITTDRIFFDDVTANAIESTIPGCESILTYFVNSISSGAKSTPYSFVTAASATFLKQQIGSREIIINDWLAADLGIGTGDSVTLRYFLMGPLHALKEDSTRFIVRSVITMNSVPSDPSLMPDFPGMSDAGNCRDWDAGAPVNLDKIRDKDELYWKKYRGTPKAFISMETGQKIWGNRFGNHTAFRIISRDIDLPGIEKSLMQKIKPNQNGLIFRPVYDEGQFAADNSTDFGELFLSLSFFILLSALLLTSLLFSLHARSRIAETGVLLSLGFRKKQIFRMLAIETSLVALAGAVPGILLGIAYNQLLVYGLNTIWNDAVNTSQIGVAINFQTLVTGALMGIITSLLVLFVQIWRNLRKPISLQTKGTYDSEIAGQGPGKYRVNAWIAEISLLISVGLLIWLFITGQTMNVTLFLASGGLMLLGGLASFSFFLKRLNRKAGKDIPGFRDLVFRNVSMQRSRTIASVTLLSLGTFVVMITGANHKTFYGTDTSRDSGTGGFLLWTETILPINMDLNSKEGALKFGLTDEKILEQVRFVQLSRLEGDDASCLNLNQVSTPVILGIPSNLFNQLNCFSMVSADKSMDKKQPWKYLSKPLAPDMITGFADQTVITWGLRKLIGDTLYYKDEYGKPLRIKIMAGLDNSIFQGNILVSDSLLRLFYPSIDGSHVMLVDGPPDKTDSIAVQLETLFRDYGMMAVHASKRLAAFNAVENTYLTVFMILGGLGIIIGTLGLGIVLLRNIRQRQPELSAYIALGFRKDFILKCLVAEHLLILVSGIFLGSISALAGILPSLISPAYKAPGLFIPLILGVILANGFLWIWFPARAAMKKDLIAGLRYE